MGIQRNESVKIGSNDNLFHSVHVVVGVILNIIIFVAYLLMSWVGQKAALENTCPYALSLQVLLWGDMAGCFCFDNMELVEGIKITRRVLVGMRIVGQLLHQLQLWWWFGFLAGFIIKIGGYVVHDVQLFSLAVLMLLSWSVASGLKNDW